MSLLGLLTNESEEQNMMRSLIGILFLALATPSWAQKIETEAPNPNQVIQVHTALNHLTVIEAGEPVVTVATGSDAFKVEWRGNKVFVEPTEPNQSTNLFIWTASGRLNYELDSAGPVGSMDFAIDHPKPATVSNATTQKPKGPSANHEVSDPSSNFSEMNSILEGRPVQDEQLKPVKDRVNVTINELWEQKDVLYIRYEIRNDTRGAYCPRAPKVMLLSGARSSQSLVGREDTQLSAREADRLTFRAWAQLQVVGGKTQSAKVAPSATTSGVVEVRLAPSFQEPRVLRFEFGPDGRGVVTTTLVL
jgi:Conjugal transfer protein